jgi:uncharacterized protein (DUF169 family)
MFTILLVAAALSAGAAVAGFALGWTQAASHIREKQVSAAARLAAGVRRFVLAHLPRSDAEQEVIVSVPNLERLHELADASDHTTGDPLPPLPLTRRVLKASAERRSARNTERIAV